MTRFCEDAIPHRSKGASSLTSKDLKRDMQKFLDSGLHPQIEEQRRAAAANARVVPLPEPDVNREFIFLDFNLGSKKLGRLVIELYEDLIPVGALHLKNRVLPGSQAGLQGSLVHKLMPGYAVWLGRNAAASEGMRLQPNPKLKHVEEGAVSISLDGDEVAVSLGRALPLDSSHQVVGRAYKGQEILQALNDVPTNHEDVPKQKLQIVLCGVTNAAGNHEELESSAASAPKKDAAQLLAEASSDARQSVMEALQEALPSSGQHGVKRPAECSHAGEGGSTSSSGTAKHTSSRDVKRKFMDSMLGDLSGSDVSSDDEAA